MKTKNLGFTLVELIVVITILAILGTIGFISLNGYSASARDAKRISDTSNLLNKINIEVVRGVPLNSLVVEEKTNSIIVGGNEVSSIEGRANFLNLRETGSNFKDPRDNTKDYPIAYLELNGQKFYEIATISEVENKTKILGNYYKIEEEDSESLFGDKYYNNSSELIYEVGTSNPSNPGSGGENNEPDAPIDLQCGELYIKYENSCIPFVWEDLTISDGEDSITIMDRNLGAIEAGTGELSYGNYYQWGNNYGFPNSGIIKTSSNQVDVSIYEVNNYKSDVFITTTLTYKNWMLGQNNNLWGGQNDTVDSTDTSTFTGLRQGPCPEGYHIPSTYEWKRLVGIWFQSKGETCNVEAGNICPSGWPRNASLFNFLSNLKIPLAGYISRIDGLEDISSKGNYGYYWSSSPKGDEAYRLLFYSNVIRSQSAEYNSFGFPLRCFKN